jgi:hypothetical protein
VTGLVNLLASCPSQGGSVDSTDRAKTQLRSAGWMPADMSSEEVALGHPVMPVADCCGGRLAHVYSDHLRQGAASVRPCRRISTSISEGQKSSGAMPTTSNEFTFPER